MTAIRHRESKLGWLHVLTVAFLLLGFGLTTVGPGGVAVAASRSGRGGSGAMSGRGSSGHHGTSAARSTGSSRSRSISPFTSTSGRSTGFSLSHGTTRAVTRSSGPSEGLRTSSFGSASSLHMRGLQGIGGMDYRPLTTRTLIGPRPVHEPQSYVASPVITGGRAGRSFGTTGGGGSDRFLGVVGERNFGRSDRFDRSGSFGRFDNDRFFDFGGFDRHRDHYRFDRDDYARFHCYGYYRFRFPTIVAYNTFLFPDEFLFGDWFGSDVCWWSGNVVPSAGVTVVLVF